MANRIRPLSEVVASQVASTKEIHSLKTAVLGLLENSLDARSSKIEITINFARRSCKIEDNGHGIAAQDFESQGGLCKRHHTAKQDLLATGEAHSCDGTFLASLATLSLLSVTSKIEGQAPAHLLMHQGQRLVRTPPAHELVAYPDHGTRVLVDDLFGNLPVRVKQYALSADDSRAHDRLFDEVKHGVLALLLAWSRPCSVRLQDQHKRAITLTPAHPNISHALTSRALNRLDQAVPKYSLQDKLPLLFQAGYATALSKGQWVPISASTSKYTLQGLVCSTPAPSARCQFISIGPTPLKSDGGHVVLYQMINKLFNDSSFGMSSGIDYATDAVRSNNIPVMQPGQKGVDKWPMFVINITRKQSHSAASRDLSGTLDKLLRLTTQVIARWLEVQGFQPVRIRRTRSEMQYKPSALSQRSSSHEDSPAKKRSARLYTPPWTSIKSGQVLSTRPQTEQSLEPSAAETDSIVQNHTYTHVHNVQGNACCQEVKSAEHRLAYSPAEDDNGGDEEYVPWQDPITKRDLLVSLRTGMTVDRPGRSLKRSTADLGLPPTTSTNQEKHTTSPNEAQPRSLELPEHLQTWQPPVFAAPLQTIPRSKFTPGIVESTHLQHYKGSDESVSTTQRLTRSGLIHAKIIAQVDSKFILCVLPAGAQSFQLVLLDQHAISERILLEQLLTELCSPLNEMIGAAMEDTPLPDQWSLLQKPVVFETTAQEASLFRQQAQIFSRWGVVYDVLDFQPHMSASQVRQPPQQHRVSVRILPQVIAERCRSAPKVLVDLMRAEIWRMSKPGRTYDSTRSSTNEAANASWLTHIGDCPKGILDLVNSRACRSAVMFNDPLTIQECEELVKDLSNTAFPWICAHGRTSAVPIMESKKGSSSYVSDTSISGFGAESTVPYSSAYTKWTSKA